MVEDPGDAALASIPIARLDDSYVDVSLWADDHWSTLAYTETVMVECGGFQIGFDPRMRQGRRHFRVMHDECPSPRRSVGRALGVPMDLKYSTRLANGVVIEGHDDWHCVQDIAAAGLFTVGPDGAEPGEVLHLSAEGQCIVGLLRVYKAAGGKFSTFRLAQAIEARRAEIGTHAPTPSSEPKQEQQEGEQS